MGEWKWWVKWWATMIPVLIALGTTIFVAGYWLGVTLGIAHPEVIEKWKKSPIEFVVMGFEFGLIITLITLSMWIYFKMIFWHH
ncbi:MAG: hypothetical protein QXS00_08025 [Pyrobaculum sp.]